MTRTEAPEVAELLRSALGRRKQAFGLASLTVGDGGAVEGSLDNEFRLPAGPDDRPAAGALGVLVDDALGFALIAAGGGSWSVSVEISMDFVAPLPTAGVRLRGRCSDLDGMAGFARGEVRDEHGDVVVHARQHGRYVPRPALPEPVPATVPKPSATVLELLGATMSAEGTTATVAVDDPTPWHNAMGALHGGVAICAVEAAATGATLASPTPLRTTSLTVAFARPMTGGGHYSFAARSLHTGRTLQVVEVVGTASGRPCTFARVVRQSAVSR